MAPRELNTVYRGGWKLHHVAVDGKWERTASLDGRVLPQGKMTYHQLIANMDRILGLGCFEDFHQALRAGATPDEAEAATHYTTEEAWERALAESEGRPWSRRETAALPLLAEEDFGFLFG